MLTLQHPLHPLLPELETARIVSIVRGVGSDRIIQAAEAVYAGGIRFLEVTFDMA